MNFCYILMFLVYNRSSRELFKSFLLKYQHITQTRMSYSLLSKTLGYFFFSAILLSSQVHSVSIKPQLLTIDFLKSIRTYSFTGYDFIIIDKNLMTEEGYVDTQYLPIANDIRYKYADCSDKMLQVCESHRNAPIILIYNKVVIEYEQGWLDKFAKNTFYSEESYKQKMKERVKIWANKIYQAQIKKNVQSKQQIEEMINEHGSVFLMVENKTVSESQNAFKILAKNYFTEKFIYFSDLELAESLDLNLTVGKFIQMKKDGNIKEFPEGAPHRYQIWQKFVQENLFWSIKPIYEQLTKNRFDLDYLESHRETIIFCDMGLPCLDFMKALNEEVINAQNEQLSEIMGVIVDSQSAKNVKILELYYHLKLTDKKMPLSVVINGTEEKNRGVPRRFVKQLQLQISPTKQIQQLWSQIDSNNLKSQFLSSGIPKKNGYTGKGSEKLIQKLSFQTYKQAILKSHQDSSAYYFMFLTAIRFDCKRCSEAYSEIKKFASFVKSEDRQDIKFGMFDLSSNQIDLDNIENIPVMLIFKPGSIEEDTLKVNSDKIETFVGSYTFDGLNNFVKGLSKPTDSEL